MNRTWYILLWLLGEAILMFGFVLINKDHLHDSTILKMIVSSIIFTVLMLSLFKDSMILAKRGVSSGMKWFFTITYALLSVSAMFYFEFFNPVDLLTQAIVQSIFLAVLAMGMWGAFNTNKRNNSNQNYEKMEQQQLRMIRNVFDVARSKAEMKTALPPSVFHEIIELQQEVQDLKPGNDYIALKMEGKIMVDANQILQCLKFNPPDLNLLEHTLKHCFKLIREFQNTYSTQ